jgi:crossover junction endodeoxyribonuclease RuvC
MKVIMGIDPGSRALGFGVISVNDDQYIQHIDHGIIRPKQELSFAQKLNSIAQHLHELIQQYQPKELAVENIFLGKNPQSAFKLGHVRGICLQKGAEFNCSVFEYAPRKIKKIVTGNGAATKEHVKLITLSHLGIETHLDLDATDALSMALGHAYTYRPELPVNSPEFVTTERL